jgi:hypothetical protein
MVEDSSSLVKEPRRARMGRKKGRKRPSGILGAPGLCKPQGENAGWMWSTVNCNAVYGPMLSSPPWTERHPASWTHQAEPKGRPKMTTWHTAVLPRGEPKPSPYPAQPAQLDLTRVDC